MPRKKDKELGELKIEHAPHVHQWILIDDSLDNRFVQGDLYLRYTFMYICDCGVWKKKEFIHIDDEE